MPTKVRVLVVDDSALMRQVLTRILSADRRIEVVGVAPDAAAARRKIKKLHPDVLTLDVDMPGMDGLAFLENLMRLRPMPVVMVSSLTRNGARVTLRALELGAVDFVTKPGLEELEALEDGPERLELVEKVVSAASARVRGRRPGRRAAPAAPARGDGRGGCAAGHVVAVGASTGGTEAIRELLALLPASSPPILVVQHIPGHFSAAFAERLDEQCALSVREAEEGEPIRAGQVLLAPGDRHLVLERHEAELVCRLGDGPPVNRHRPSVDLLFRSVAGAAAASAVGVLLTGMGRDGAAGLLAMREAGALTLVQDRESSVVWGMPGSAVELGAARAVLSIQGIAGRLASLDAAPPAPGLAAEP